MIQICVQSNRKSLPNRRRSKRMSIMRHLYVKKEREYTRTAALKNVCQVPPWSIQSVVHTVAHFSRSPWSCTAVRALLSEHVLQGLCSRPWLVKKVLISWTMIFSGVDTSTGTPASSSSHFRFLSCCCCWPCFCNSPRAACPFDSAMR